jgi:hypothetical protein
MITTTSTRWLRALVALCCAVLIAIALTGCEFEESSDDTQRRQQEQILKEGTSAVGMPAITNFTERRLLKDIIELRDQANLITYTYLIAEQTGKLVFLGQSIGYGIPYATQYTNPQKIDYYSSGVATIPQADPNGLFSPESAEGTWVLLRDPKSGKVSPVYVEPKIIVSQFRLTP